MRSNPHSALQAVAYLKHKQGERVERIAATTERQAAVAERQTATVDRLSAIVEQLLSSRNN